MTSIITQGDNGPTLEELTKKLRKEVGTAVEAQDARAAEVEREKMFKGVGIVGWVPASGPSGWQGGEASQ